MIVLAENFSETEKSNETIQYFLSGNPKGRLLNIPKSIEMNSYDQPYS